MKAITSLALVVLGLAMPSVALAGANKTWVSGTGKDTGTCPITAPCASFQYAVNQTAAGGEVDVKDAGGYGLVTINKAISIVAADGVLATISVPQDGIGIQVAAGTQDRVVLRGLTIDGHSIGEVGVLFTSAGSLSVRDTHIANVSQIGLVLASASGTYTISNVEVQNSAGTAILLLSSTAPGLFNNLKLHNNGIGLFVQSATASVYNSIINSNGVGINSSGGADIYLGDNIITENTSIGVNISAPGNNVSGSTANSFGDNYIKGNTADVSGGLVPVSRN